MDEKEKKAQEMYMQFQFLEKHIKQMNNQLELITQQLIELTATSSSLEEFDKISMEREVLVPLSSGIFAKAAIKDTSELIVNVGANVVVKKGIDSTKKLIKNQIEEIRKVQKHMVEELEKMTSHAAQIEMQLQKLASEG